jgi:hypothetical protein
MILNFLQCTGKIPRGMNHLAPNVNMAKLGNSEKEDCTERTLNPWGILKTNAE